MPLDPRTGRALALVSASLVAAGLLAGSAALVLLASSLVLLNLLLLVRAPRAASVAVLLCGSLLGLGLGGGSAPSGTVSLAASRGSHESGGADVSHRNSTLEQHPEAAEAAAIVDPIARTQGIVPAIDRLAELEKSRGLVPQFTHLIAHDIGAVAFKSGRYKDPKEAMYQACDNRFQFGCIHGVIESYFETGPSFEADAINNICGPTATLHDLQLVLPIQCIHSLAHAIVDRNAHDLFASLPICERLDSQPAVQQCLMAAFMANTMQLADQLAIQNGQLTPDAHSAHPSYWSRSDLNYPCNAVAERFKNGCYLMQPTGLTYLLDGDFARVASACTEAGSYRARCMSSFGREMAADVGYKPEAADRECRKLDPTDQLACYSGAAQNLTTSRATPAEAMPLCRMADVANKTACYRSIGQNMHDFFPTDAARAEQCAAAEAAYVEMCTRVATSKEGR